MASTAEGGGGAGRVQGHVAGQQGPSAVGQKNSANPRGTLAKSEAGKHTMDYGARSKSGQHCTHCDLSVPRPKRRPLLVRMRVPAWLD